MFCDTEKHPNAHCAQRVGSKGNTDSTCMQLDDYVDCFQMATLQTFALETVHHKAEVASATSLNNAFCLIHLSCLDIHMVMLWPVLSSIC